MNSFSDKSQIAKGCLLLSEEIVANLKELIKKGVNIDENVYNDFLRLANKLEEIIDFTENNYE